MPAKYLNADLVQCLEADLVRLRLSALRAALDHKVLVRSGRRGTRTLDLSRVKAGVLALLRGFSFCRDPERDPEHSTPDLGISGGRIQGRISTVGQIRHAGRLIPAIAFEADLRRTIGSDGLGHDERGSGIACRAVAHQRWGQFARLA